MEGVDRRGGIGQGLELAKWVGIVTMTVDHYGKIVAPEWYDATHAIGRLAYPLFASIVGLRLAGRPEIASRYLRRLVPWAIVSQPIYVLAGKAWLDLNILATLACGVALCIALAAARSGAWPPALLAALVGLAPAHLCEFGVAGVLAVPLVAVLAGGAPVERVWVAGPVGVFANLVPALPPLVASDLWALGATPVMYASLRLSSSIPRLTTHAFYAYYPLHLLVLDRLDRWM